MWHFLHMGLCRITGAECQVPGGMILLTSCTAVCTGKKLWLTPPWTPPWRCASVIWKPCSCVRGMCLRKPVVASRSLSVSRAHLNRLFCEFSSVISTNATLSGAVIVHTNRSNWTSWGLHVCLIKKLPILELSSIV